MVGTRQRMMASPKVPPTPFPAPPQVGPLRGILKNTVELKEEDIKMTDLTVNPDLVPEPQTETEMPPPVGQKIVPPWRRAADGTKIKKKKKPAHHKHRALRRWVTPKNALMCLNEIKTGIEFNLESDNGSPFRVSVEIDGKKYYGMGSNKNLAKQAAAEAALSSFVKPTDYNALLKSPTPESAGEDDPSIEDTTPWASLASFAIYKLFNEWKDGRIGTTVPPTNMAPIRYPDPRMIAAMHESGFQLPQCAQQGLFESRPNGNPAIAPTGSTLPKQPVMKPAKEFPKNAAEMHPMMLLNQHRPDIQITCDSNTVNGQPCAVASAVIDGRTFEGRGPSKKRAKLEMAKCAVRGLFQIESLWQGQA